MKVYINLDSINDILGKRGMVVSGNLNAVGDPTFGTFNTQTKAFTADGEKVV